MRDHLLGYPAAMNWIDPKPEKQPRKQPKKFPPSAFQKAFAKQEDSRETLAFYLRQSNKDAADYFLDLLTDTFYVESRREY